MAFINTTNGAKAVLGGYFGSTIPWSNTLWFTLTGFDGDDMLALGEALYGWWDTNIAPLVVDDMNLQRVQVYDMRSVDGGLITYTEDPVSVGGSANDPIPYSNAAVVTFRTSARGRFARGRNYVSGFPETIVSGRVITQATADALAAAYQLLASSAYTAGWDWVIRSTQEDGVTQDPAVTRSVTLAEVRTTILGNQRLRNQRP